MQGEMHWACDCSTTDWQCAFTIYQQLSGKEKGDLPRIKVVLYTAFAIEPCIAYEQFVAQNLRLGKTVDIYLTAVKKLAILFSGQPE